MKGSRVALPLMLLFTMGVFLLGCGGGGGGGSDGGGQVFPTSCVQGAGVWHISENPTSNCGDDKLKQYDITVAQTGCSITVTTTYPGVGPFNGIIDGSTMSWKGSYPEEGGTSTTTGMSLTLTGDPATSLNGSSQWVWSGPGIPSSCSGTSTTTGVKTSSPSYTLAINAPNGSVAKNPNAISYASGTPVQLTATPSSGYTFTSWSGDVTGTTNPVTVTMDSNKTITANFTVPPPGNYTLAINAPNGTVAKSPDLSSYAPGTKVTLVPVPNQGYTFTGWSGDLLGTANPGSIIMNGNKTVTAIFIINSYTLNVTKGGNGTGSITGTGISCGNDCSEAFNYGQSVTLTATPGNGSTIGTWVGCDNAIRSSCTIQMTTDRNVSLDFGAALPSSSITITNLSNASNGGTFSSTDTDGAYWLNWNVTGLSPSSYRIEEAPNTQFTNPTFYYLNNAAPPYGYLITNKPDGMYCYRVGATGLGTSNSKCITVARPTTGILKIVNNSSEPMVSIILNHEEHASCATLTNIINPAGGYIDFTFTGSGTLPYKLSVGSCNGSNTDPWFDLDGNVTISPGNPQTVSFNNPTLGQLLTNFKLSAEFIADYLDNGEYYSKRFVFQQSGAFTFYDSNGPCQRVLGNCSWIANGSGTATLVSWPPGSLGVTFKLCSTCREESFFHPFGSIAIHNGPRELLIEYVRQ